MNDLINQEVRVWIVIVENNVTDRVYEITAASPFIAVRLLKDIYGTEWNYEVYDSEGDVCLADYAPATCK